MLKKDWKKNLLRVQQIANQNLGRAEKSEVLSEELQTLEKRVDIIKQVCKNTQSKLGPSLQNNSAEIEKRQKKLSALSHTLIESATLLGHETLMGQIFQLSGDAQGSLANEQLQYELKVENEVTVPLNTLLENDIPHIQKLRKHLNKLTLDMDSSKSRYHSVIKQQQSGASGAAKVDSMRDEMEDARVRMEQCRDLLATEMYTFVSKEPEYSTHLFQLVTAQLQYHQRSIEILDRLIPQLQEQIEHTPLMPVYGFGLADHLRRTERDIATVLEGCICTLLTIGMDEEGLFRVAGSSSKVKKLKAAFDSGHEVDMEEYVTDIHCIAGALKLYLRELPEPLMTYDLYHEWMAAIQLPQDQRLQALWVVLDKLPKLNYNNLRYLMKFLSKLAENQELNKMSPSNIAIVMGPNLCWAPGDGGPSVLSTSVQSAIVESLITHCDYFFPGDIDFHKTAKGMLSSPHIEPRKGYPPPPPHAHLMAPKGRPKSTHAALNSAFTITHQTLVAPVAKTPSPQEEKAQQHPVNGKMLNFISTPSPRIHKHMRSLSACEKRKSMSLEKEDSVDQDLNSTDSRDSGLEESSSETMIHHRKNSDCSNRRTSWRERPLIMDSLSTSTSNSSVNTMTSGDGDTKGGDHSSIGSGERLAPSRVVGQLVGGESSMIHDSLSDPGTSASGSRFVLHGREREINLSRSTTPPPKPPPPRSHHSDTYDTMFALHTLGNGWSDYLTRVRTLWDGHLSKQSSNNPGCSGAASEIDFNNPSGSTASDSPTLTAANGSSSSLHSDTIPTATVAPTMASAPVMSASMPGGAYAFSAAPAASAPPPSTLSASAATLTAQPVATESFSTSPKVTRRMTKKPAPLPPGGYERPMSMAHPPYERPYERPTPAEKQFSEPTGAAPHLLISPPTDKTAAHGDRPPLPDRPSVPPPTKPSEKPPLSPEKPEKPEKPPVLEKPVVQHVERSVSHIEKPDKSPYSSLEKRASMPEKWNSGSAEKSPYNSLEKPRSPQPERPKAPPPERPHCPPPEKPEKPHHPPGMAATKHDVTTGTLTRSRPPRPTPPPPPPPDRRSSQEPKAPLAEEELCSPEPSPEKYETESAENTKL